MNIVINGDFETPALTDWHEHYGTVYNDVDFFTGKNKRKINWDTTSPNQPPPAFVDATTKLPEQAQPIAPYGGTKMVRLNDLEGGQHVTCLHQDMYIPANFSTDCAYISFDWGAMLQGSNHNEESRPRFTFEVKRRSGNSWKKLARKSFFAPASGGDGWNDIRAAGQQDAVWYKAGTEKNQLVGVMAGDLIRIRFVAEDCPDGAHGGAAFIDNVIVTTGCDGTGNQALPIAYAPLPNVFTPNGDGVNDIWTINGLQNACLVEFELFDRWGDRVFYFRDTRFDGVWPAQLQVWNGKVRSKRRRIGSGKRKTYAVRKIRANDMNAGVVYYVLKLSNCHETLEIPGFMHIFL